MLWIKNYHDSTSEAKYVVLNLIIRYQKIIRVIVIKIRVTYRDDHVRFN